MVFVVVVVDILVVDIGGTCIWLVGEEEEGGGVEGDVEEEKARRPLLFLVSLVRAVVIPLPLIDINNNDTLLQLLLLLYLNVDE